MGGVLIHDGRRIGHRKWTVDAISSGSASGAFLTPFSTPRVSEPRHPSATEVSESVRSVGGEVVFDPMTHAALLPGSNRRDFYDAWELWGPAGMSLANPADQLAHVERVFDRQTQVGSPHLAPTTQLSSPLTADAVRARSLARLAKGVDAQCWQSLVGTRGFWAAGAHLDAYIGSLAALRAPTWVITVANELVVDQVPDLSNIEAFSGLCRTVHSLSLRARVIVCYGDYSALPAVAAGADSVGSGWDRGQRTFDPLSFRVDSDPGIRIPASYITQGNLQSVLRRDTADAIERWNATEARRIRGDVMPPSDQAQRLHHLHQLSLAIADITSAGKIQRDRVARLRTRYANAATDFDTLLNVLPRVVRQGDKAAWTTCPSDVLEAYASAEGI